MEAKYFDAHTHVHFVAYENDYREVIERALKAEVGMILVGTQKDTSKRGIEVAHEFENEPIYAAVGLHPIHTEASYHDKYELGEGVAAEEFTPSPKGESFSEGAKDANASLVRGFTSRGEEFDYEYYKKLAVDPKVVAIGECGLDYYRVTSDMGNGTRKKQYQTFKQQILLAKEVGKPLMVHCRDAFKDLIGILVAYRMSLLPNPGVIHFFTGSKDDASALLDLGFSFTFGGVITFARDYDEAIRFISTDRILSETDAPYVSPAPYRGKRNEPAYIVETVKKLAELKNVSPDEMAERILGNAKRVFAID